MTYRPPCPFRACGFTWEAGLYPLSPNGLAIIAEHNGVRVDQLPRGARNSSSACMRDWMEALGARKAAGLPTRVGKRWMLPGELAA